MKIIFYTNTKEKIYVDKNDALTLVAELNGTIKNGANLIDPVIRISTSISNINDINYCYIEDFGRYYYVTSKENVTNYVYDLTMRCDVLMSFREGILNNGAIVARNENDYNLMLDDGMFQVYSNPIIQTIRFPNSLSNDSYILTVAGGTST